MHLEDYRPEVLRLFAIGAHYSSPVDYSEESMAGLKAGWERLYGAVTANPSNDEQTHLKEMLAMRFLVAFGQRKS